MKTVLMVAVFYVLGAHAFGQTAFQDLDFEAANLAAYRVADIDIPIEDALPGWQAGPDLGQEFGVTISHDSPGFVFLYTILWIYVIDSSNYNALPFSGNYSVFFDAPNIPVWVSQSGLIPAGTTTIQLDAVPAEQTIFSVTLNDQTIPMAPQPFGYGYVGDVSAFAGQQATLTITVNGKLELDNIAFSPEAPPAPVNQVLSLDGVSACVSIPTDFVFPSTSLYSAWGPLTTALQNTNAITVESWIYPESPLTASNGLSPFIIKPGSYELDWKANPTNAGLGGVLAQLYLGSTVAALGVDLPESNWVHLAFTFDSSAGLFQLFTNGLLAAATQQDMEGGALAGLQLDNAQAPLNLGGLSTGTHPAFAHGYMDEVRVWNQALSAQDVFVNKSCLLTVGEAGLVGYWNFDSGTVFDVSLSGNTQSTNIGNVEIVPITGPDVMHAGCGHFPQPSLSMTAQAGSPSSGLAVQLDLGNLLPAVNYQLQFSPTVTGPWSNFGALFNPTSTSDTVYAVPPASTVGFFRAIHPN